MRKWINLIVEFEKPITDQGGLPPVADIERDDGGNSGGDYWVGPTGKVVIDKDQYGASDHAQMVYRMPEAFGISREELMKELEEHGFNHANVSRWYEREAADNHDSDYARRNPDSSMGEDWVSLSCSAVDGLLYAMNRLRELVSWAPRKGSSMTSNMRWITSR